MADISRSEFERNKRRKRLDEFTSTIDKVGAGLQPQDRAIFGAFAQLGGGLGDKLSKQDPAALTPDENRSFDIMEAFNQDMRTLRQDPAFQALDATEQSYRVQQLMADKSADAGDFQSFTQISQDLMQKKVANRTAAAQADRLEGAVQDAAVTRPVLEAEADATMKRMAQGTPVQMVRVTDGKPDLGAAVTVRQMPDGTIVDVDAGTPISPAEVMLLDDAIELSDAATVTGDTPSDLADTLFKQTGVTRMGKLREGISELDNLEGVVTRAADAFQQASDPQQIVGTAGGLLNFASNLVNALKGSAKNVSFFSDTDENGNPTEGATRFGLDNADEVVPDDAVPPAFRRNAESALKYKSAVMQLVYADARLEEPGARQLSDADIKNAMDRLGVSSGDPSAVLSNLESVMNNRLNVARNRFDRFGNRAIAAGLDRGDTFQRAFGVDPLERIGEIRSKLGAEFQRGQAETDGPIRPVAEEGGPAPIANEDADLINNILSR